MAPSEIITLVFNIVPPAAGAVSAVVAWKCLRGRLSFGITLTSIALLLLGCAHLSETLFRTGFDFVGEWPAEIVHRVLQLSGFLFLVCGMVSAGRDLKREKDALVVANGELQTSQEDLRLSNEELKERNRQLLEARALAARDGLTGIFNHRSFQEQVREEIDRAEKTASTVGLIMLDIDGFKQINDEFGHLEGDRILQEVVGAITSITPSETTYRYGGDEFAILLPGMDGVATAQLGEDVRRAVADRLCDRGAATVSIGWTSYPAKATCAKEMIYGADAAMYEAKCAGKNTVVGSKLSTRPSVSRSPRLGKAALSVSHAGILNTSKHKPPEKAHNAINSDRTRQVRRRSISR